MAGLIRKGKIYHATWREGGKEHRKSLRTDSRQIAKELLRQLESALVRGKPNPPPLRFDPR